MNKQAHSETNLQLFSGEIVREACGRTEESMVQIDGIGDESSEDQDSKALYSQART